jgi:hypothetical protein
MPNDCSLVITVLVIGLNTDCLDPQWGPKAVKLTTTKLQHSFISSG